MIRKLMIYIITFILLISCSDYEDFPSVSDWQVLYSQSENILEVSSTDNWLNIDIDESITLPYPPKETFQYIWLKGSFIADESFENLYGLSITSLSMTDRIYINGDLVGYLNEDELNSLDSPRNYEIPSGIIKYGVNDIYIRAGVYDEWNVEISKQVLILDAVSFRKMRNQLHLISEILPISILTLIIGTFFSLLFKSANERWNREYLIIAFRLIIVILCYLTFYSPVPLFSIKSIIGIWNMALPLFSISMVLLYQEIHKIRFEKLNMILIPLLFGTSLFVYILTIDNILGYFSYGIIAITFAASQSFIVYMLSKILRNRHHKFKIALVLIDAFIITANIINVGLFLSFDLIIVDPSLFSIMSGLFLTILFSIYFARRDGLQKLKMKSLLAKLDAIETRAKISTKYSISPDLENKFEEITSFIRESYTQSISREELAETVGINPNYFSSLFNLYTGKKVNEYINDLRLDKASQVILRESESIIDAAFSSGFESLTTFNRLFKKKFNCTPNEYRRHNGIQNNE